MRQFPTSQSKQKSVFSEDATESVAWNEILSMPIFHVKFLIEDRRGASLPFPRRVFNCFSGRWVRAFSDNLKPWKGMALIPALGLYTQT